MNNKKPFDLREEIGFCITQALNNNRALDFFTKILNQHTRTSRDLSPIEIREFFARIKENQFYIGNTEMSVTVENGKRTDSEISDEEENFSKLDSDERHSLMNISEELVNRDIKPQIFEIQEYLSDKPEWHGTTYKGLKRLFNAILEY